VVVDDVNVTKDAANVSKSRGTSRAGCDSCPSRDITEWHSALKIDPPQDAICSQWQLSDFRAGAFVISSRLEVVTLRGFNVNLEAVRATDWLVAWAVGRKLER
jgi:hypothetical protein